MSAPTSLSPTSGRGGTRSAGIRPALVAACVLAALTVAACRDARPTADAPVPTASGGAAAPAGPAGKSAPAPSAAKRPRIVVLGDSIAAGLGLSADQAFPAIIQQRVDTAHLDFEVVNAGVSGDTSAGGMRRLDWALDGDVRVLVLELGANDGLRGLSVDEMTRNLGTILTRARSRGVRVVLCGMEAPPNFGPEYTRAFRGAYTTLAREHDARFVPFVLAGVAGVPDLNQADGIHPNAEGARRVADLVWTALLPLLTSTATS
jgi:acyl-CoA thioesterase-1